jgi:hypothetical protein
LTAKVLKLNLETFRQAFDKDALVVKINIFFVGSISRRGILLNFGPCSIIIKRIGSSSIATISFEQRDFVPFPHCRRCEQRIRPTKEVELRFRD